MTTTIIRPTSDGATLEWDPSTPGDHFPMINDVVTQPDEPDADKISVPTSMGNYTDHVDQFTQLSGVVEEASQVVFWCYGDASAGPLSLNPYVDGWQGGHTWGHGAGYSWKSKTFTGLTLTESDVNAIEIKAIGNFFGGMDVQIRNIYAVVTHTDPASGSGAVVGSAAANANASRLLWAGAVG